MRIVQLMSVAAIAVTMAASPAMATVVCKHWVSKDNPDTAPVNRSRVEASGGSLNGTAYTKATFCPTTAAAGTCTGESISERVSSTLIPYVTFDGYVPDDYKRRYGINVPATKWTNAFFLPLTKAKDGAC